MLIHSSSQRSDLSTEQQGAIFKAFLHERAYGTDQFLAELRVETDQTRKAQIANTYQQSLSAKGEPVISVAAEGDTLHIAGAMRTSSFVINTIDLILERFGIESSNLVVSEVQRDGEPKTDLFYLKLPIKSEAINREFTAQLDSALKALQVITDDYETPDTKTNKYFAAADRIQSLLREDPQIYEQRFPAEEISQLIDWLKNNNFLFMGHTRFEVAEDGQLRSPNVDQSSGLYRLESETTARLLREAKTDAGISIGKDQASWVSRLDIPSPVQRDERLMNFTFQERNTDEKVVAVHSVVGLLSYEGENALTSKVPVVRTKLKEVKDLGNVSDSEHSEKDLTRLLNGMPVHLALRLGTNEIRSMYETATHARSRDPINLLIAPDVAERGVVVFLSVPQKKWSEESKDALAAYLEDQYRVPRGTAEVAVDSTKKTARVYFYIPNQGGSIPSLDVNQLQQDVRQLVLSWSDHLGRAIKDPAQSVQFDTEPQELAKRYMKAFPKEAQAVDSVAQALTDIRRIESLTNSDPLRVSLDCEGDRCDINPTISIYSKEGKSNLSKVVRILEKAGFIVDESRQFKVSPLNKEMSGTEDVWVSRLKVSRVVGRDNLTIERFREIVGPGLQEVLRGKATNDALNSLLVDAGLNVQQVGVTRALALAVSRFMQLPEATAQEALAKNPKATSLAFQMLKTKFDTSLSLTDEVRAAQIESLQKDFKVALKGVTTPQNAHKVLTNLNKMIAATKRAIIDGDRIVLKTYPREMDFLSGEQPLVATFISSPRVKCAHLRHSLVARGGFRASKELEGFYLEVRKLASTQKKKNGPLVVDGGKGAFVAAEGVSTEAAYKEAGEALLSITDNIKDGRVIHPVGRRILDGEDPYIVMAADVGTGTFSDIANKVSVDADFWGPGNNKFWLGHVFASGGKYGFSHFNTGVTARGALVSSNFNLLEAGIDPKQELSVVLIGDPYGDVSGNALTRRENWNVVAAWGYPYLYIDPNPTNPEAHLAERARLLTLGREKGTWDNYDKSLLSQGGGVYRVDDPAIPVTPEARARFKIPEGVETLSGDEYIKYFQKAEVDVRYGGGIGTHVKASHQDPGATQDTTNEDKLVNANEIGAKVAIEGGNNGWTQAGRIEAFKKGVRIFLDAVDNVGGVKTSNEEVLWGMTVMDAILSGKMAEKDYNELMLKLEPKALERVFQLIHDQSTTMILDERESKQGYRFFDSALTKLDSEGILPRRENLLPSLEDLVARQNSNKPGMYGPELAEFISGAKRWVKETLRTKGKSVLDDPAVKPLFEQSFPEELHENPFAKDQIANFRLKREQTATQIANDLVDSLGTSFLFQANERHNPAHPERTIRAAVAASLILETAAVRDQIRQKLWGGLEESPSLSQYNQYMTAMDQQRQAHRALTNWFLENNILEDKRKPISIEQVVEKYKPIWQAATQNPLAVTPSSMQGTLRGDSAVLKAFGLSEQDASRLVLGRSIPTLFEIAQNVGNSNQLPHMAASYWETFRVTGMDAVLELTDRLSTNTPETDNAVNDIKREVRRDLRKIAAFAARDGKGVKELLAEDRFSPQMRALTAAIQSYTSAAESAISSVNRVPNALLVLHQVEERLKNLAKEIDGEDASGMASGPTRTAGF